MIISVCFREDNFLGSQGLRESIVLETRTMLNLETLQIFDDSHDHVKHMQDKIKYFEPFFHGIQHCQNLTELILGVDMGEYAAFTPNIKTLFITGQLQLHIEDLNWIANLKKLESLTLDMLRFGDKKIDIKVCTTASKDMIRLSGLLKLFCQKTESI